MMTTTPAPMLSLLLALAACGGEDDSAAEGTCSGPIALPVLACVVPAGATPADTTLADLRALDLGALTVTDAGTGSPPEGCVSLPGWLAQSAPPEDIALTRWVVLSDGAGGAWTAAWSDGSAEGASLPAVGTALDLSWRQNEDSPFAGEYGEVRLLLAAADGGALWAWVESGTRLDALTPPAGITLGLGAEVCRARATCGEEVDYALRAAVGGETAEVPGGSAQVVGGLTVSSGGVMVREALSCSETADGRVRVAVSAP